MNSKMPMENLYPHTVGQLRATLTNYVKDIYDKPLCPGTGMTAVVIDPTQAFEELEAVGFAELKPDYFERFYETHRQKKAQVICLEGLPSESIKPGLRFGGERTFLLSYASGLYLPDLEHRYRGAFVGLDLPAFAQDANCQWVQDDWGEIGNGNNCACYYNFVYCCHGGCMASFCGHCSESQYDPNIPRAAETCGDEIAFNDTTLLGELEVGFSLF